MDKNKFSDIKTAELELELNRRKLFNELINAGLRAFPSNTTWYMDCGKGDVIEIYINGKVVYHATSTPSLLICFEGK